MMQLEIESHSKKNFLGDKYFISHNKSYGWAMPPHFHDQYEILFFLTEDIICNAGVKSYVLKSGSVAVFNDTDIHRVIVPENILHDRFSLNFNPVIIQDICLSHPELTRQFKNRGEDFQHCVTLDETQKEKMLALLNKMLDCYENTGNSSYELKVKLALCEILLYLNEIYDTNSINPPVKNYAYREQLHTITEYIKDNLSEDLNLDTLAAKFFMGKQTLIKLFKKEIGLPPNQYIIYCRIMKARELLKEENLVYKVCEVVGYSNISSFIRTFKKITGYTPTEYKKRI